MSTALLPRTPIHIRTATLADLPFLDQLQKKYSKALGFFPRAQMQGYVESRWVLIAEESGGRAIGYCASRDRYLKRDELGIIYQLCVEPGHQRGLIGASLIQAVFDRSAYGCRLYCCWCAQDLEANHFWESLGFVPIAFRGGSDRKKRVHIFWQKRIDDDATPYWYPCQTNSGAIRADRIVFPIPPGVHWMDVKAVELGSGQPAEALPPACSGRGKETEKEPKRRALPNPQSEIPHPKSPKSAALGGFAFQAAKTPKPAPVNPAKSNTPATKIDPSHLRAARELRDRWMERVNENPALLAAAGKYALTRSLAEPTAPPTPLLPAA